MTSLLPSAVILGAAAVVSLYLTASRPIVAGKDELVTSAGQLYPFVIALQALHFLEETMTGLPVRLPALFGLAPIPQAVFLGFNVVWIGIWALTVPGIKSRNHFAFFAAWFLAIAGMINGVAHPLISIYGGGYFPGLITSPAIGIAGLFLWRRLAVATRRK